MLDPDKPEEAIDLNIGVFSMFKDKKQQILWIGTDGQGLRMLYDKYERFDGLALEDLPFVLQKEIILDFWIMMICLLRMHCLKR